jgi:predicted DNA-binding transcriptional regulator YafY
MATHVITRRIQHIIQFIYDTHYPSKIRLTEFISNHDFIISPRTLDRDLERIRADYGLDILYDKAKNGYYINKESSIKVSSFFKFLEIVSIADIFSASLKDSHKMLEYVSFDDSKSFKGIKNLKSILIAIAQNRKLHFIHENFTLKTFKTYVIAPLLLKEYENRWYAIGVPDGMTTIRTFGIDRITELTIGEFSKIVKEVYEPELKVFDTIIGLDYEDKQPIKISLLVNDPHINYMTSLPIHSSQHIHPQNENGQYLVDFFLVPNYEFKAQVLKMGEKAVVVSPDKFKNEIKEILQNALKRY